MEPKVTHYSDRLEWEYEDAIHIYFAHDGANYTKLRIVSKLTGDTHEKDITWRQSDEYVTKRHKREKSENTKLPKKDRVWVQLFKNNARSRITGKVSFSAKGLFLELLICLNKGSGRAIHPTEHYAFTPNTLAEYLNESVSNIRRWLNELQIAGLIYLKKADDTKKTSKQYIFVNHQIAFSGNILSSEKELEYFPPNLELQPIPYNVNSSPSFSTSDLPNKPKKKRSKKGRSPNLSAQEKDTSNHRVEGSEIARHQEAIEASQLDHPRSNVDHPRPSYGEVQQETVTKHSKAMEASQLDHERSSYRSSWLNRSDESGYDPMLDDFVDEMADLPEEEETIFNDFEPEPISIVPQWQPVEETPRFPDAADKARVVEAVKRAQNNDPIWEQFVKAIQHKQLQHDTRAKCIELVPKPEKPMRRALGRNREENTE